MNFTRPLRPRLAPMVCLQRLTGASQSSAQFSKITQTLPEKLATSCDPRFNGSEVYVQCPRDLVVTETLYVAEHDGLSKDLGQGADCRCETMLAFSSNDGLFR